MSNEHLDPWPNVKREAEISLIQRSIRFVDWSVSLALELDAAKDESPRNIESFFWERNVRIWIGQTDDAQKWKIAMPCPSEELAEICAEYRRTEAAWEAAITEYKAWEKDRDAAIVLLRKLWEETDPRFLAWKEACAQNGRASHIRHLASEED